MIAGIFLLLLTLQFKPEGASLAFAALYPVGKLMTVQNSLHNAESKPAANGCTLVGLVSAVVSIPDVFDFFWRNAISAVADFNANAILFDPL